MLNLPFASAGSLCYGDPSQGRLEAGESLPAQGSNFRAYSLIGHKIGRTYVHSKVKEVMLSAYRELETTALGVRWVYGETGWAKGGDFWPHKTHQNGLSVDHMVPVIRSSDKQFIYLPTSLFNKWGYGIEFDNFGNYKDVEIDFEAMGEHLFQLYRASESAGLQIERVIFDPQLQTRLYKSKRGSWIRKNIYIPKKQSWVRHDEHYHIDFKYPCQRL